MSDVNLTDVDRKSLRTVLFELGFGRSSTTASPSGAITESWIHPDGSAVALHFVAVRESVTA